jgi:hypothetical protein
MVQPGPAFYTASPDVLVALVRAFNSQRDLQQQGYDILNGGSYYEFGLYRGFSLWFAEQLSREYAEENFRCLGFDSFAGAAQAKSESGVVSISQGRFHRITSTCDQ